MVDASVPMASPPARAPRFGLSLRRPRLSWPVALALVPAAVVVGLLALVLWLGVRTDVVGGRFTLGNFGKIFADPIAYSALLNTFAFASTSVVVSLLIGAPLAWLVERTDLRAKSGVAAGMTTGLLIPGFMTAMGWLFLWHPRSGVANRMWMELTGSERPLFNVVNVFAMGFVEALALAPVVFVMAAAPLRALDASLEEAAMTSGAGLGQTLRRITFPLVLPSLLGAAFYVFVIGIAAFDLPAVIGGSNRLYLFSTFMTLKINPSDGPPDYGIAAAFSTFMIALGLLISWAYTRMLANARRYQTVGGKSQRSRRVRLGRWAVLAWAGIGLYFALSIGLPLLMLVWTALLPFLEPPSAAAFGRVGLRNFQNLDWGQLLPALRTTLTLVITAPVLALSISLLFSWIVLRGRNRLRLLFDTVAFLPHAVPSIIFGFAILLSTLYVVRWPVDLYGSLFSLILALALVQLSFGTRVTNGALIQINAELEEAAYMSGAPTWTVLRRIVLPLVRPALAYGFLWLAMLTFRELTLSNLLSTPQRMTLPVAIFSTFNTGRTGQAAAASLVLFALLLPVIVIYLALSRRAPETIAR